MKHLKNSFVLFLFFIIAVSCNKVSTSGTTPSPIKTETALKSTKTAHPTETSVPVNLATSTPLPPETQIAITTMEAILEVKPELKEFYFNCCLPSLSLSPDGKWAVFYNSNNEKGSGLSIVNTSSKEQWNIFYYDVTGTIGCDCFLEVVHWSKDGSYVYIAPRVALSAGADLYLLLDAGTQLIRVNLDDGNWVDTKMGIGFSFSPNDRFIAYRREQDIVIYEFQTGNERIFPMSKEYVAFGHFVWSPDNKNISFIGSLASMLADENTGGFTLFVLDIDSKKPEIILKNDERYLYPLEWQETNTILLESLYTVDSSGYLKYSGEKYELNLITNEADKLESP
jgi:Tol biopolymer transport system component